jgi:hypothetical protein
MILLIPDNIALVKRTVMFYTRNKKARKYFVGRRLPKGSDGTNIFYSVPVKKTERKAKRLTLVQHSGDLKVRLDLNGSEINQLLRILTKGRKLMR